MDRRKEKQERIRLSLTVTPAVRDRLERIQNNCEAESITEVIRRALAVYEDLLSVRRNGGKVLLKLPNGETESLRVI